MVTQVRVGDSRTDSELVVRSCTSCPATCTCSVAECAITCLAASLNCGYCCTTRAVCGKTVGKCVSEGLDGGHAGEGAHHRR